MRALASTFEWCERWDIAVTWREEAWLLASSVYGVESQEATEGMELMAISLRKNGNLSRAIDLQRTSLEFWSSSRIRNPGAGQGEPEQLRHGLPVRRHTKPKAVLSTAARAASAGNPRDAVIFEWLAASLSDLGEVDAAADAMKHAYESTLSGYGNDHELTHTARENLAMTFWNSGDLRGAMELFEEDIRVYERSKGVRDPRMVASRASLDQLRKEMNN